MVKNFLLGILVDPLALGAMSTVTRSVLSAVSMKIVICICLES